MIFQHNFVPNLKLQQITDGDGKRRYVTPNGPYESVTTYLARTFEKPWLKTWKTRVGEKKAKEITAASQKRGKSLHTAAEQYLLNTPINLDDSPNTKILFLRIRDLLDRCNNIKLIEKALYSDELELAGTPDIIADYDNVLSVIDVKSNNFAAKKRIDLIDYMLQTACYAIMFQERYGSLPQQSVVIVASPNSNKGTVRIEPMDECIRMLYNYRRSPVAFAARIAAIKALTTPKTAPKPSNAV